MSEDTLHVVSFHLQQILQYLVHFGQGSNLTFELNSHMASTCSGFTSHKRVSTSLGTSVQHKMKKMSKILLLSNVNKNCNIRKI